MPKCEHIKPDGSPCGSPVMTGRRFCYFHDDDPRTIELRAARSAKGGSVSRMRPEVVGSWTSMPIKSQEDIRAMLSELANAGMLGTVLTARLSALAAVANSLSKVIEQGEMERRLTELEKRVGLRV
jgi:hypothetical protein